MTPSTVQTLIILGSLFGGFLIGPFIGRALKMPEHGWKLGVILATIGLGVSLVSLRPVKQGIDLRGGVILIYEVDTEKTKEVAIANAEGEEIAEEEQEVNMQDLISALSRRINPGGVREVVIRAYGDRQVEIIIPDVSDSEIEVIKESIVNAGFLKFRIVADRSRNPYKWELAEAALSSEDKEVRTSQFVKNEAGDTIGEWVLLGREDREDSDVADDELTPLRFAPQVVARMLTRELLPGQIEAFTLIDPDFNVEGRHLRNVRQDIDQTMRPSVGFNMSGEGAILMGGLTSTNLPDQSGVKAPLGIVMDGKMLSAPVINSQISNSGVIEGNFTEPEVDFLVRVLRAGKLPAVLKKVPISENQIDPLLGADTIKKGKWAIGASLLAVLIFMLIYYMFAGFVACLALILNLVLIVALMILIKGAFTLPGLAGLVLTVGMSVDANVLIFERIREELKRGAGLRMAIRNGFGRATSTVVDANLTTLIAAIVLYVVGTEVIKGFAITLILGILVSLYTAIFCSRVVFDIAERKKWITKLGMMQALGETKFDFLGKRGLAAALSIAAIVLGLSAVAIRGSKLLDIDFTGGTSVQIALNEGIPIEEMREKLTEAGIPDFALAQLRPENFAPDTVYKIDSSIVDEDKLRKSIEEMLKSSSGENMMKTHEMEFTAPTSINSTSQTPAVRSKSNKHSLDGMMLAYGGQSQELPILLAQAETAQEAVGEAAEGVLEQEPVATEETGASEETAETETAETESSTETPGEVTDSASFPAAPETDSKPMGLEFLSQSSVKFDEKMSKSAVQKLISAAATKLNITNPRVILANEEWNEISDVGFTDWDIQFTSTPEETAKILAKVEEGFDGSTAWLSSNKFGSKVAGDMKTSALTAIFVALAGIVGYIWLRFQNLGFGLAAVVALLHDVAITLGAVAASFWLAKTFGFLMIEEFKISLPIVAAFLTIIGYSLNDTIVVFDRIREVKGKSPHITKDMINKSINQTLSRTLLTSVTTLIVVAILYAFGGQGIHGFAFALLIGVLVGTYSSIFVASPALLWLTGEKAQKKTKKQLAKEAREKASVS